MCFCRNKHIVRHVSVPSRGKMILAASQNFKNITSLASQDWWMISSSCQFTEFKIKLTLGKLFFTKINDSLCCFSILMMAFFRPHIYYIALGSFSWLWFILRIKCWHFNFVKYFAWMGINLHFYPHLKF